MFRLVDEGPSINEVFGGVDRIFWQQTTSRWIFNVAPYVAPLCPVGHLPHTGGDRSSTLSPIVAGDASRLKLPISPRVGEMSDRTEGGNEGLELLLAHSWAQIWPVRGASHEKVPQPPSDIIAIFQLAFPDHERRPAAFGQDCQIALVTLNVAGDFGEPIVAILLGNACAAGTVVTVPETAVDEYGAL
jgi:hypothetical protein